jgi:PAS domain-containing protein/DNA-binding CsgD family transcriptional regulator
MPLVDRLYDSIADDMLWQDALGEICASFGSELGFVALADTVGHQSSFIRTFGNALILRSLQASRAAEMPFYPGISNLQIDQPVTVDMLYDMQGPGTRGAWLESPLNRNWAMPNGLDDFLWVALLKHARRVANLIVVTPRGRSDITSEELAQFASLAPHVRRALLISDLLETERHTATIYRSLIDALRHPVIIVAADLRVLYANAAAERLLSKAGSMSVKRGILKAQWPLAEKSLEASVRGGIRDECALGPAGINIPLPGEESPSVAHVLPLARRDQSARIAQDAVAAIFVAEAGQSPEPAFDALMALFGLTSAEARVATQIGSGLNRHQVADTNRVSDGTVKSQLNAVFGKTGTSDQRELSILLRDLAPPIRGGQHN